MSQKNVSDMFFSVWMITNEVCHFGFAVFMMRIMLHKLPSLCLPGIYLVPPSALSVDQTGRWPLPPPPPPPPAWGELQGVHAALTLLFATGMEDSQTGSEDPSILHDVEPIRGWILHTNKKVSFTLHPDSGGFRLFTQTQTSLTEKAACRAVLFTLYQTRTDSYSKGQHFLEASLLKT